MIGFLQNEESKAFSRSSFEHNCTMIDRKRILQVKIPADLTQDLQSGLQNHFILFEPLKHIVTFRTDGVVLFFYIEVTKVDYYQF